MAAQHYVSKFHLREFCDPRSLATPDPWLWVGNLNDGSVKRRSPKNVGTAAGLFEGPGGLSDRTATLEDFLANKVEGPASLALRTISSVVSGDISALPEPLMRYLAWAAARSLPMQRLEIEWANRFGSILDGTAVEPPPDGLADGINRRDLRLLHPASGEKVVVRSDDASSLFDVGWIPDPSEKANFLEGAHIQAYYFQARWFPRLHWFTLRPPSGSFFVIGDRPVGWGVPDCLDAPPCCLRDPSAFLIAPLTRSLALVGRNDREPWSVTPTQVNAILASWSHDWIAGPTSECVVDALRDRKDACHPHDRRLDLTLTGSKPN